MIRAKIEVYTSPTCPHCPHAKKVADEVAKNRDDVKVIEISTGTKNGQKKARNNNVRSVPTIFVTSSEIEDKIGHVGTPSKKSLNKMIDLSLGKEEWPEHKGLFQIILDKLKIKIKT